MTKINVALLFGGKSSEHEISKLSMYTIANNLCKSKYNILPIYITKKGEWKLYEGKLESINTENLEEKCIDAIISPDTRHKGILKINKEKIENVPIDIAILAMHGKYGEDGTMQGLFEIANIPYVGCGVFASATAMDKCYTKLLVDSVGVVQARYIPLIKGDEIQYEKIENYIKYPCFVKPANSGSSKGISKAHNKKELEKSISDAYLYDNKVLIEETIVGREVECAVLGNIDIKASQIGEIIINSDFYDYNTKYNDNSSRTIIPKDMSKNICDEIRQKSIQIFKAIGGRGLARIDFFIEKNTNRVVFNEINTMPGFTNISMYPILWNNSGLSISALLDELISLAFDEFEQKNTIME